MDYKKLKNKFLNEGFFEKENFFSSEELAQLRKFVNQNLSENKDKTFFLSSSSNDKINIFFNSNKSICSKIKSFLKNFSEELNIESNKKTYSVLRVIKNFSKTSMERIRLKVLSLP